MICSSNEDEDFKLGPLFNKCWFYINNGNFPCIPSSTGTKMNPSTLINMILGTIILDAWPASWHIFHMKMKTWSLRPTCNKCWFLINRETLPYIPSSKNLQLNYWTLTKLFSLWKKKWFFEIKDCLLWFMSGNFQKYLKSVTMKIPNKFGLWRFWRRTL
jgi:hypothetical protein